MGILAPPLMGWFPPPEEGVQIMGAPLVLVTALNQDPPILGFASISWKDSAQYVSETGEFVWNLVTKDLGEQMNQTSSPVAHGVDEFQIAGLTAVRCRHVKVPRVLESRAAMECKVTEIV